MNTPRTALAIALAIAAASLSACASSSSPSSEPEPSNTGTPAGKVRAPDALGTVISASVGDDSVVVVFDADPEYSYFENASLNIPPSAGSNGEDGVVADPTTLVAGDRINIWVGICVETFPVQCEVERVELEK